MASQLCGTHGGVVEYNVTLGMARLVVLCKLECNLSSALGQH
jgi:hypothetical protein